MNKVSERCQRQASAKFYYASKKMFTEVKLIKVFLYILAIIPVLLQFIPVMNTNETMSFFYTVLSFAITILNEVLSSFLNNHKESAILEHQLYESEITGSTFSKIEYDRESTNSLNELAIRKGLPKMRKIEDNGESYHTPEVPQEISDDYSYLFLCRQSAAKTNFILSRMFVFYAILLGVVVCAFIACIFWKQNTADYLKLLIGFYPLVNPFIKNCAACKKAQTNCVKICADIDNFFADGDASIERLARFYYYTQNIEFEMMVNRPAIYSIFPKMFTRGISVLESGVTIRFKEAVAELYGKSKGLVGQARGKELITRVDYDIAKIEEKERRKKLKTLKEAAEEKRAKALLKDNSKESTNSTNTTKKSTENTNEAKKTVSTTKINTSATKQAKPASSVKKTTKTTTQAKKPSTKKTNKDE